MASEKKGGISGLFNSISLGGIAKFTFQAVVFGLIIGGIMDFTLFHDHPMGAAILDAVSEPVLSFYDGVAEFIGRDDLTRPVELLAEAGSEAAGDGVCSTIDPTTYEPVPCS